MGFLDDLKKYAGAAWAQINPRDNGRTWDTETRGVAPGTPRRVSTPAPTRNWDTPRNNSNNDQQEFKGFTLDEGKNKTLFGWNAAALLPKQYEKVYGLKTDRNINSSIEDFVSQFDKINPDFQKKYVSDLEELAKNDDQAAIRSLEALRNAGKFQGDATDFIEGSNERLFGGLARGAARTVDWVLPGKNTFGLEQFADDQEQPRQFTDTGRAGEKFGTAQKGIVDVAAIALPSGKAENAIKGTKFIQNLGKGGKVARFGAKVLPNIAADLTVGNAIDAAQERGRGNDYNWARSAAFSVGAGAGVPLVGAGLKKGAQVVGKGVETVADNLDVAARNPAVQQVDDHIRTLNRYRDRLLSRGLKESDPALVRNAQAVKAALETKNSLVQGINQGGYIGRGADDFVDEAADISKKVEAQIPGKSKFAKAAQTSGELSEELRTGLKEGLPTRYSPVTNQAQIEASEKLVKRGLKNAATDVTERLNKKLGTIADQDVSDAITVIKGLDEKGTTESLQQATDIIDNLSAHLTKQGQSVQAASILSQRTPQGLLYSAQKALKKGGVEITPDIQKNLNTLLKEVKKADPGTIDHELAIKTMQKYVADNIPSSNVDKAVGVWKAGLLTGARTQTGNALSNTTFGVLHDTSKPGAAAVDKLMSLVTGKRTIGLTGRGRLAGQKEGLEQGWKFLKSGIDERSDLTNKFDIPREINFENPVLRKYVNGVFRLMGAADRPAYYSQLRNSLYDVGTAEAKNQGLKGKAAREFVDKFVKDPPTQAFQTATDEAEKAVLANDTFLADLASSARNAARNLDNPAARNVATGATNIIAPFTRVPSAFVSRVFDFTPAGAIKEAAKQISKGTLDQRALSNAISEAGTGTALVWLGAKLADSGQISGAYPSGDPKEQARWRAEGIQPNSVKVGGNWYTLNYFGPVGALFGVGKQVNDTRKEGGGAGEQALNATAGVAQTALDQSFLQGVSGALDAVNDPARYAENFVKNQAGSVVPTLVKDVGEALDPLQREVRGITDAVKSRIPGVRETLPAKTDVFGNELDAKTSALNTLINPLRPSKSRNSELFNEVNNLKNNTGEDIFPTPVQSKASFDGVDTKLSDEQKYNLQNKIGQKVQDLWTRAIGSDEYKKLDNDGKVDMLLDLKRDATSAMKREFAAENSLGQYGQDYDGKGDKISANEKRILDNDVNFGAYASRSRGASSGYSSTELPDNISPETKNFYDRYDSMTTEEREKWLNENNDAEYQYERAEFERKDKAGTFTKAERIRAEKSLAKEQVGSKFSKDIRDIYSLSKADIQNLLESDPEGEKWAEQLLAYDKELYDKGLVKYLKFKYGFGSSRGGSRGGRKGGKGRKAAVFKPPRSSSVDVAGAYKALASLLGQAKVTGKKGKKL